jgi:hypothetical protein
VTDVYVETGTKRVFASALAWPGWARSGRDERAALDSLVTYGPRYRRVVARSRLGFRAPTGVDQLAVVLHVDGDASTDFGVPGAVAPSDRDPIDDTELKRSITILRACWRALDTAAAAAAGRTLTTGPRGGGRSLGAIVEHVTEAERGYLGMLGSKAPAGADARAIRAAVVAALTSAVHDGVEERGPRGGKRWPPPYFVRRVAWHTLDHAWEIEDRSA